MQSPPKASLDFDFSEYRFHPASLVPSTIVHPAISISISKIDLKILDLTKSLQFWITWFYNFCNPAILVCAVFFSSAQIHPFFE